jgi:hypothetical protein
MDFEHISPEITERHCGGWIAVSEVGATLRIGVTAPTEDAARTAFAQALAEWSNILASRDIKPMYAPG